GVTPDSPVGVAINRSSNLPVLLLGIMKAGGCYLPLDPHGPPERLTFMLSNSQATILVTQTPITDNFSEYHGQIFHLGDIEQNSNHRHSRNLPKQRVRPSDLAYVIYTSGSTGQPKGVEITHRSLVNFLYSMSRKLGVTNTDVFLAVTPITFDIAALELFLPLSVGARVILLNEEEVRDGHQLIEILRTSGATVMQATPATWHMLLQAGWEGNKDLKILSGGEALSRELAEKLLTRSREVWNLYGPTETTIWSTAHKVRTGNGPVSIGRPIDNTRTLILDKQFQLTPIGIPGELYIGGEGVARGYRGRPDLTTERFQVNPFWPTERLYKTGDIAKWKPDGCLDYLGRIDHQVKIRGVRIELQEIESRLNQLPEIHQSVVLVLEASQVDKKLIAFIQADPNTKFSPETVQNYLREYLPAAMIPSEFIFLTEFPLTPNGKLDRQALLCLRGQPLEHRNPSARPENELQRQLISIWERLLDIQGIGIDDHYFDLGGHSILALQLFTEIEQVTGIRLPLATLFKA
ncbi:MAG: non-ribosomal peptide synthetase, partial [Nitrospira sp.]|nr:non-ribosomal peptide synthetase [Nitrospira sp.]